MAFAIDNCLIQQGSGTNYMYVNCCCDVSCTITNLDDNTELLDYLLEFDTGNFTVSNPLIDGNPISLPFFVPKGGKFTLSFTLCGPSRPLLNEVFLIRLYDTIYISSFQFDFSSIDFSNDVSVSTIDFGNVGIGFNAQIPITITNSVFCCSQYSVSTTCNSDVQLDITDTNVLCLGDSQTFYITFSPTKIQSINCELQIGGNMCVSLNIPITGNGVEPPTPGGGGNPVSGPPKKVVDCPTDCKLFNPQPGFSQKTKNAINQISRATSPKGGPGRGTNFGRK